MHTTSPGVVLWHFINRPIDSLLLLYVFLITDIKAISLTTCYMARLKEWRSKTNRTKGEVILFCARGSITHRITVWRSRDLSFLFSLCHWIQAVDLKESTHPLPFVSISCFQIREWKSSHLAKVTAENWKGLSSHYVLTHSDIRNEDP